MKALLNSKKAPLLVVCLTCLLVATNAGAAEVASAEAQLIADAIKSAGISIGTFTFIGLLMIAMFCE